MLPPAKPDPTGGGDVSAPVATTSEAYVFEGGFPTPETVVRAYDDADLNRAIQAYRFFYPSVSFTTGFMHFQAVVVETNRSAAMLAGNPKQVIFTPNSDTPYSFVPIDL